MVPDRAEKDPGPFRYRMLKELLVTVLTAAINERMREGSGEGDDLTRMIFLKQEIEQLNRLTLMIQDKS